MERMKMKYQEGVVYTLHQDTDFVSEFKCLRAYKYVFCGCTQYNAEMVNIRTGWTFTANGTGMYEDGTIDWDFSSNGHFSKMEV